MARALTVTFGALVTGTGNSLAIYASPPSSAGRTRNAKRNFKLIQVVGLDDEDPPFVSYNFTAAYVARYGNWPAGSRIFVTLKLINSHGIAGAFSDATCVSS